ncbi:MAG TPA: DUF11 domain-containing protein, partial [Verrucomicrobiae bacterium]|nr:DUF11 domain-containing protein [Verrucomicrobiae bacterium]
LIYDPYGQRFIFACATAFSTTSPNPGLLVAVSRTSDPTGLWNRYFVDVDTARAVYGRGPSVGFNKNWIVVQLNMFSQADSFLDAADVFAFNKTNLYAGGAGTFTRFVRSDVADVQNAPVPAATYDANQSILYFLANWNADFDGFGFLRVFSLSGTPSSPVFNDGELIGLQTSAPGWLDYAPNDDNFAAQLGTTNKIYLGDARLQNVVYRYGSLWTVHSIFVPTETSAYSAIQWWEVTPGGATIQRGVIQEFNDISYGYPSIAVNTNNDAVIAYSKFAPFTYAGAAYSFRVDADTFSSLRLETVFKGGEGPYSALDAGLNRWGEWSSTTLDPNNDTEFWTVQEYAASTLESPDRWGVWWARISPPQDLSVTMTDSPDPIVAGNNLTYTINVKNERVGRVVAGARIVDTLPPGAVFVSAVANSGTCTHTNGVVTCNFGTLPSVGTASATIVVAPSNAGLNTNRVQVLSNGAELTPNDSTVQVVTTVNASADVTVSQTAFPSPVPSGSNLTFSVLVTNRGPSSATGVILTDTLPPNATYVAAVPGQGSCTRSGNTVTCNLGSLANRGVVAIAVVVTGSASGSLTNRATVTTSSTDGNSSNNSSTNVVRVNMPPTLQAITDRTIDEDTGLGPLSFTVGDTETPVGSLTVQATSSNQTLVPNANIVVAGTTASRSLTLTPAP